MKNCQIKQQINFFTPQPGKIENGGGRREREGGEQGEPVMMRVGGRGHLGPAARGTIFCGPIGGCGQKSSSFTSRK